MKLLKKKLKSENENVETHSEKRRKLSKQNISTLVAGILLVLTHIAIILAIILSFRYYSIYPSLFGSIVAIVVCLMIIVDIVFFVGFNHKDLALKIISCTLCVFLLVGGTIGTVYVAKANNIVDSVLDGGESAKKEVFSGVFVCYSKEHKYSALTDLNGKSVGMLVEQENGISYVAKEALKEAGVDYGLIEYKTNAEMIDALIDGEINAMAITSAYRTIYSAERDENSPFAKYLDDFVDFAKFEKELKVNTNRKAKNVTTDPFNVLLIGYSRTEIGSPVGLADSIILATINPQTYTVSMMSIARDSFVPIACYGGEYDKINSGRSTSRACFIETVENFIGMDIDYYMELDYLGLVEIVNTIGGVKITNPVEFELDGIYVPEGTFLADGQQALQFCRERHHMPNGDFDRQQHQKEVIIQIAKTFIEEGEISLALRAMKNAEEWMSTDLSLNQLTTIFNLLLNTKNYTGLDTFDLVDFQTLRMTGNGGLMYYSYSMHLPLWVYLIYQGSYDESMSHVNDIMGNFSSINQDKSFTLSMQNQYVRPLFYSLTYDEKYMFTPDPMPPYWADLSGMTLQEALAWATEKGVNLTIGSTIAYGDSAYNPELEGLVVDQSVRYGSLISEYKDGTITIMGSGEIDESLLVPDMEGWSLEDAIEWAYENDVEWNIPDDVDGVVTEQSCKKGTLITACSLLEVKYEESVTINVSASPSYAGTVSGGGRVVKDKTITLKAVANPGYKFVKWSDGETSLERNIVANRNDEYVAEFAIDVSSYKKGDEIDPSGKDFVIVDENTIEEKDLTPGESYYTACVISDINEKKGTVTCKREYHKGIKEEFKPHTDPCNLDDCEDGVDYDSTQEGVVWSCSLVYEEEGKDPYCSCTPTSDSTE